MDFTDLSTPDKLSATCNPLLPAPVVVCSTAGWPFIQPRGTADPPWELIPDRPTWVPGPSPWIQPGPMPIQPGPVPEILPTPGGGVEFRPINGGDMAETVGKLLDMLAAGGLTVGQFAKLAESGDCEHIVAFLRALEKRRAEDDGFNVELDQEMSK